MRNTRISHNPPTIFQAASKQKHASSRAHHDDVLEVAGLEEVEHVGEHGAVGDGEERLGDILREKRKRVTVRAPELKDGGGGGEDLGDEGRELLGGAPGEDDDLEVHLRRRGSVGDGGAWSRRESGLGKEERSFAAHHGGVWGELAKWAARPDPTRPGGGLCRASLTYIGRPEHESAHGPEAACLARKKN